MSNAWTMARFRLGQWLVFRPRLASFIYTLFPFLRLFPPGGLVMYVCACGKRFSFSPYMMPLGDTRVLRCEPCRKRLGP